MERVIGRLATDEDFRRRFETERQAVIQELSATGLELTPVEAKALLDLNFTACRRFARCIDARLQKVSLRRFIHRRNDK
ncbi:MAG: hypothetical protein DMF51_12195 [Acidobacteria bacterium]|nr:MAG: hypothetical protein DMF51_12195 [Acidobacteriota bacterium]